MSDAHAAPGRPRHPATDQAILDAAAELLAEVGLDGTTLAAVARRANVARATIYLRWPNRHALIGAAVKAAVGGDPFPLSGDLAADITTGALFTRQAVAPPAFRQMLPELVGAVLSDPPEIPFHTIAPNRVDLAEEYRRVAAEEGFDPAVDPNLAFDMLLGAQLVHILATRSAPSAEYVRQLARAVIQGLRATGT
jgi:AcrR family transcriptional regulator